MIKHQPTVVNISPVLRFHEYNKGNENAPVALLLPWATATERAIDRFRVLYAERGFNVLTAYPKPIYFFWPSTSVPVAAEIVEYLCTKTGCGPIVVHAFSLGAYLYNVVLAHVIGQHQQFRQLRLRICGHVFDSIIIGSLKEMRVAAARMVGDRWLLQQLVSISTALYFFLTQRCTVKVYNQLIEIFWKNPFETPLLCYYSLVDPMCHLQTMKQFLSAWEARTGQPAHYRSFPDAPHAEILRAYPQEYRDTLFEYLDTLKIREQFKPTSSKL